MRVVRLFIPGQFEDAFVYMGRIVCLSARRTIQVLNLDAISTHLSERYAHINPVPTLMFSRNDWIAGQTVETFLRNQGVAQALLSAFDSFPQPYLEIHPRDFSLAELDLNIQARALLDLNIYNGRIYVGADSGLYDIDLDWTQAKPPVSRGLRKRTDARCVSTSVGYGSVNASCGRAGLLSSFDDFGWTRQRNGGLEKVADESIRSGWLYFDLVNYTSQVQAILLRSEHEKARSRREAEIGPERERRVITAIGTDRIDLDYLFGEIRDRYGVEKEAVQFAYNSRSVVFIHTIDGHFYSLGIKTPKQGPPRTTFHRTYKGAETRILSANATAIGLVIETDRRVSAFSGDEWFPILESEVISIRTFARSRRYRNMVALTTEEGLVIAGLYNENPFHQAGL